MTQADKLLGKIDKLLERIENLLPDTSPNIPDKMHAAMRWQNINQSKRLLSIPYQQTLSMSDLLCINSQKQILLDNTKQFIHDYPANNVLLCGPRGTGKSSLVKTLINEFIKDKLIVIEVPRDHLQDLTIICQGLHKRDEKFILFCDDLSFEPNETDYKSLKVILDGSLSCLPDNIIIYATSNRRHLIPEYMSENQNSAMINGEIQLNESLEEKLSLSERFGIWLSFQAFKQEQYLEISQHWLKKLNAKDRHSEETHQAALQWALEKGSRSGRTAWQFARDWTGKQMLKN